MSKTSNTKRKSSVECFSASKNRKIAFDFDGGDISSNGGLLLLSQFEKHLKLLSKAGQILDRKDKREQGKVKHFCSSMLRQRILAIAAGHEDGNDHIKLCKDTLFQEAVGRDETLASSPTLSRFENVVTHETCVELSKLLVEEFISSFKKAPKELVLDFDATDDLVHGEQEGRFFNGYYGNYCFLPLYVFCGRQLLVSYLRTSGSDGAKHAWAILGLLTKRFRKEWPEVKIIFRGDCGFCRHRMLTWCENNQVDYIVGIGKNSRITAMCKELHEAVELEYKETQQKVKRFTEFSYAAEKWTRERRVIGKAEYNSKGANNRYILTTLSEDGQYLYETVYCGRGDMENRIKEQQLDLFADRTSCHFFIANQFRLLLSSLAYILLERFRALSLSGTELATATCGSIRLKLVKIGAVIRRNTRKIYVSLSSAFTQQSMFWQIVQSIQLMR